MGERRLERSTSPSLGGSDGGRAGSGGCWSAGRERDCGRLATTSGSSEARKWEGEWGRDSHKIGSPPLSEEMESVVDMSVAVAPRVAVALDNTQKSTRREDEGGGGGWRQWSAGVHT